MSTSLSKRKRHDYVADSLILPINPIRRISSNSPISSPIRISVTITDVFWDNALKFYADSSDTIKSIHDNIHLITGIPVTERRLFYGRKQLHWEQTLAECGLHKFAGLSLVAQMRSGSTKHPKAWELINEVVSFIFVMCNKIPPFDVPFSIKLMLAEFLEMIPRADIEQACGHLKMFSASSAPTVLVKLYMSPFRTNKSAADEAIRYFLTSIKSILPKHMHHQCVPMILEFCKLLKEAAGIDDPLYRWLMLVDTEVGKKAKIEELAAKLSRALVLSVESRRFFEPSLVVSIRDFSSFVAPHIKEMKEGRGGPDEATNLYGIFNNIYSKFEWYLGKLEDHLEQDKDTGFCCHYIGFIKQLNISKIYNGGESIFWEAMKSRKGTFCKLVLKAAKRGEDHSWIFECKEMTNFETRRHLARMILPMVKDYHHEPHEMLIDRSHLLAESFEYIKHAHIHSLRAGLFMAFKNEEATGPGVLREWFSLVCQAVFNLQNALFVACSNDRRRFYPNPASKVDPVHVEYFGFTGKLIALALMHNIQVGIVFDRVFFLQLAGHTITLEDIRDADPLFYNSCKQILEMDPEAIDQDALGLTFVHEVEELGTLKTLDLCTNGKSIAVNSKNRRQYVDSLIQHRFVISVADQVEHFAKGFADIIGCRRLQKSFFKCLELEDLDWMLYGSESAISVDDWKAHTKYEGFKETEDQISWFWKVGFDSLVQRNC
ncbi:E3 ubiquitin-protein ligase UPL5-like isoform X2 [Salvia hispanica]|uniref:E3 ubiquitin-protein ligase UPL5-like isoform X2 n=1 Tax=Salvia hispanica TaxID=49212 RepID=UPI002009C7EB|nr:E3 ubiquitin-protein ligase UPL5-like isoform X2 [Salvia hispanica]